MIRLSTLSMQFFAVTFGLYHAVLGFLNLGSYAQPGFVIVALTSYVLALGLSVLVLGPIALPGWVASINLVVSIMLPLLVSAASPDVQSSSYTTWYVAGVGTLLAITAVRSHTTIAWIGIIFLILEVLVWGGSSALFNSGLVGAVLLVLGAQAAARVLAENAEIAKRFRERALMTEAATAAKSAARLERERRLQQTLTGVLPQLEKIVAQEGNLSKAEKELARLTEAQLRDQIRGRGLSHPELAKQTLLARSRGIEVQLLDDGGLEDLDQVQIDALLMRVANELKSVKEGKVVIRSVAGESWNLTMAAIRKGAEKPDIFLRL